MFWSGRSRLRPLGLGRPTPTSHYWPMIYSKRSADTGETESGPGNEILALAGHWWRLFNHTRRVARADWLRSHPETAKTHAAEAFASGAEIADMDNTLRPKLAARKTIIAAEVEPAALAVSTNGAVAIPTGNRRHARPRQAHSRPPAISEGPAAMSVADPSGLGLADAVVGEAGGGKRSGVVEVPTVEDSRPFMRPASSSKSGWRNSGHSVTMARASAPSRASKAAEGRIATCRHAGCRSAGGHCPSPRGRGRARWPPASSNRSMSTKAGASRMSSVRGLKARPTPTAVLISGNSPAFGERFAQSAPREFHWPDTSNEAKKAVSRSGRQARRAISEPRSGKG